MDSPILDALPDKERLRLLDRAVPRQLSADETLHHAGAPSDRMHFVTSGLFKFVGRDGSGNDTILGIAVTGDVVGELPWIDGLDQPFDVIATTKSTVLSLDAADLLESISTTPRAVCALLELQAARLRWVYGTCLERSAGGVPARLAGRLLDLADMLGEIQNGAIQFDMPLPQSDIGRLAGVCRESACKTLRRFKSAGIVDYQRGRLRILRPDVLEKIRCAGRA